MSARKPVGGTGVRGVEVEVDGHRRTAVEVAPSREGARPDRVVLAVHGSNQSPARFRAATARTLDALAADGSSVVVYPASWRGGLWNDARVSTPSRAREDGVDDVALLRALVEQHRARGVRRVVAVGFSNGGQLLIRVLRDTFGVSRPTIYRHLGSTRLQQRPPADVGSALRRYQGLAMFPVGRLE